MNEKEFEECSVVAYPHEIRFLHIKGGCISYYVDRHISDYVNKIQKENQQLKGSLQTYEILLRANVEENKELKKQLEEVEFIVGLRQKRSLISKFDKEYDEEDKKKNPNRDYAGIMPDAEEIYRRYYTMKNQQKEFIKWLEKESKEVIRDAGYHQRICEDILEKYKEIVGSDK